MSQVRNETIICPHCQTESQFEIWSSVNVDIDPELKEKVLSEELFLFRCPNCGEVTGIPYGTVYHDMSHRFMLFFDFFKEDDFNYEPLSIPEELMNAQMEYTFRQVFGINRLKEKIFILEQGLNDIAIERMKYMISHIMYPEISEKGYELYFAKTEGPDEEFEHGTIYFFYRDEGKEGGYNIRQSMDSYYENRLACELDPRLTLEGSIAQCVDEGWYSKILKEG